MPFADVPPILKAIQPYMKTASEHEKRDPVVTYWCCFYALQSALKIDKKSKDAVAFLTTTMDWLEKVKRENKENEAIHNEIVAQAYMEEYALKLFFHADGEDRAARFNKNVVKAFYTAGLMFDVLDTFGELSDEIVHHRKYAKWKATYIHNCLKNGEVPKPGPMAEEGGDGSFFGSCGADEGQPFPAPIVNPTPYPSEETVSPPTSFLPAPTPGSHAPPSTPSGSNHPSPSSSRAEHYNPTSTMFNGVSLNAEDFHKAQKYCKFAGSALQYEDVPTAVDNLQRALLLLTTGKDQ